MVCASMCYVLHRCHDRSAKAQVGGKDPKPNDEARGPVMLSSCVTLGDARCGRGQELPARQGTGIELWGRLGDSWGHVAQLTGELQEARAD
jgi:hypothetical protein